MGAIVADLQTVLERIFDRWEKAFWSIRVQDYTATDAARDWADGMMDATYLAMLPAARLNGVEINTQGRLAIARFIVTDKSADITQVVRVEGGTGTVNNNLTHPTHPAIPAAGNYTTTLAVDGTSYMYVTIKCAAINGIPAAAGVYTGIVNDTGTGAQLAKIILVWPG